MFKVGKSKKQQGEQIMFKDIQTSELIRFINSYRYVEDKLSNENFKCALDELEKRSPLMAMIYKIED